MLARIALENQLVKLGIFTAGQTIKQYQSFNDLYQNSKFSPKITHSNLANLASDDDDIWIF